jgi:GTPase SAR1 family protein
MLSRQVSEAESQKFCQENKLAFIEASAKTGENINKIFETITSSLFEAHHLSCNKEKDKTIILDPDFKTVPDQKKKKCCK